MTPRPVFTATLVSEVEMNARFAKFVQPETLMREMAFFDHLTALAGKTMSGPAIFFEILNAMKKRETDRPIELRRVAEALCGENNPEIAEALRKCVDLVLTTADEAADQIFQDATGITLIG